MIMPKVELIYDKQCPNVERAREALILALNAAGLDQNWTEWDRDDPNLPEYAQGFGSPTILVDERDVSGAAPGDGANACRVYTGADGKLGGVPETDWIVAAIRASAQDGPAVAGKTGDRRGWLGVLGAAPVIGVLGVAPLACPACWPAYIGLLSSLGIGLGAVVPYLFPITAAFLLLALAPLWLGAKKHKSFGPFILGVAASAGVIAGMFWLVSEPAVYLGAALMIGASVWNVFGGRNEEAAACPACVTAAEGR